MINLLCVLLHFLLVALIYLVAAEKSTTSVLRPYSSEEGFRKDFLELCSIGEMKDDVHHATVLFAPLCASISNVTTFERDVQVDHIRRKGHDLALN